MSDEMKFFMYLTEYYAEYKGQTTAQVITTWEDAGITQKIYDNYWLYHTERIENAYDDIDRLVLAAKKSY